MRYIFFFILIAGWQHDCRAQANATPVSYNNPGTVYTQNFDGLPNSGNFSLTGKGPFNANASPINGTNLVGWQLLMIAGTNTNASFSAGTGSSTGNGVYSFGNSGSAERALGTLASSTGIYAIGFILTNNTGGLLNSFTVSFTAEQWRKGGSTNKNSWNFRFKTGSFLQMDQPGLTDESHLSFSSVINTGSASSLNGNLPENQQNISYTINTITWKPGEQLLLRWDDADEAGNDDACSIDNLSFSASLTSSAPIVLTKAATNISSNAALLAGSVNDNFANTSVVFEYDSLNTLENAKTVHSVPDTIIAASGNTIVSATLSELLPGVNYYYRVKATNNKGSTVGSILQFITPISLPVVLTGNPFSVTTHSAYLGGNVTGTGGSTITEKGIVWALTQSPVLTDNKMVMGSGAGSFAETVSGLPGGSKIYARAFATNAGGTAYGDSIVFTTQTTIISLSPMFANKTNSSTVTFLLQTDKAIDGLTASNFMLQTVGITGAFISGIGVSGNIDTLTVNTGTGNGLIGLCFNNNTGLSVTIENSPFTATGSYTIDKTPPGITSVIIPDHAMKIDDTIPVTVSVIPDTDNYKIISGNINGSNLFGLIKNNDSIYTSLFAIQKGGNDVMAQADISVSLIMADSVGNNNIAFQSPIHQSADQIDANAPFILSAKNPPDSIYKFGDELDFIFYFNEKVQVIPNGNTASLAVTIGTKSRQAVCISNNESDSLVFRYTIQSGDLDKDGIKKGNAIALNNTEINDLAGNITMLSFSSTSTKNITVDAVIPTVSNTTVPVAAAYRTGNILDFMVNYSKKVMVTSIDSFPVLQVLIGSKIKNAEYISGSGSPALLFRYTIQQDDFDKDGIKLASSVILSSSTIKDEAGNNAQLVLNNIGSMTGIKINPVTAAINKVMVPMNGIYKLGDTLEFIADYNENVWVDTGKGIPAIKFVIGSSTKQAVYQNGSGSNELLFSYIIQPGEEDTNGIKINSTITLNNGAIWDALTNPVPVSLNNVAVTEGIRVDAVVPVIKSVSIPANKLYKLNDTLDFIFHFSEKINVEIASGKPDILLTIGSSVKNLSYVSGSGTDDLLFRYIVPEGDFTKDGIKTGTTIQLNNAKIKDGAGNIAATLFSTPSTKAILIDGVSPAVTGVTAPIAGYYRTGDTLYFMVNYTEKVVVISSDSFPALQLGIGTREKKAAYVSGSGTGILLFRYIICEDDIAKEGIQLPPSPINLNNTSITDVAGNHALGILMSIGDMSGIRINAVTAVVNKVSIPENGMYKTGDTLDFIVSYSEKVRVSIKKGIPTLIITIGNLTKQAVYKNGSESISLLFEYIIQSGDESTNTIKINNMITLNNGSITDTMNNNAATILNDIGNTEGIKVDAVSPLIKSICTPPDRVYKSGDTLDFIFRFTENITLTSSGNTASLSVTIGNKTKSMVCITESTSDSLVFRYVIQNGDLAMTGIKTGSAIQHSNTEIRDIAGNIAVLTYTSLTTKGILIDAVAPTISSVTTPAAAIYRTGNMLDFIVNYSEKVIVAITDSLPLLEISIGTNIRTATYISGSGSNALLFRYTIEPDDIDNDGIKLLSTINHSNAIINDEAGNNAFLVLNNIGTMAGIKINPVTAVINKVIVPSDGVYKNGDPLEFIVSYNERVLVDTGKGIPSIKLIVGTTSRQALYKYGSGGNELLFAYIIQPGEEDTNGIKISNTLLLNNGTVTDALNNPAPLLLNNIANTDKIRVDAVSPTIKSFTVPANKLYTINDTLDFVFHFSEILTAVIQSDSPFIQLTIGNMIRQAGYVEGSGTDYLLFRYTVQQGDLDKNGIRLGSSIQLNNSSILDLAGNPLLTSINNAGIIPGIKIDGIAPSFVKMKIEKLLLCENSSSLSINPALAVSDEETGESIVWNIISGGSHGYLSTLSCSGNSTGKTINPNGFIYYPFRNHQGTDSLLAQVSDGINVTEKMIIIEIQPAILNNSIAASQVICINNTPEIFYCSTPTGGDGQYKYGWESASADSIQFSKAAGTNDSLQYSPGQLKNDSWFRRRVNSGMCTDTSSTLKITVVKNGLWLGHSNNDWNDPANWCNQSVPNNTTDVMLNSNSVYDPFIKDSAWCHHLLLATNTHLTVTGILQLSGNLEGSGKSIAADKGEFIFEGKSQQPISGSLFKDHLVKNIVIRNDSGVALLDTLQLSGTLVLNKGFLLTNDFLTLQPAAMIGSSAAGTTIIGNVFIEHLIKGGRRCFWLLGHPFVDDIGLQKIKDSIDITGEGGSVNGFTNSATNEPSAFRNNPFTANDSTGIDAGWIPFTQTNSIAENAWKSYSGIRLLMRGRPGQGLDGTPAGNGKGGTYLPEPVIIKVSGKVHTGDQEIPAIKDKLAGYNVIANPYPSNIDLSLITHSSNVGPNYWVWNPWQAIKGGYTSIPFKNKNILPPFGAFIVRANENTNNTLLFTENCKTTGSAADSLPVISMDDTYLLELRLETDSIFWDRIMLLSLDSAKNSFDKNDAEKFENSDVNFFSISKDQKRLSIDARPLTNESSIPLGIEANETGKFSIRVARANLPIANKLMLHDRYLGKWMPLEKDSSYSFSTNADSLSQGNKRFEITGQSLSADTLPALTEIETTVTPVPAKDQVILRFASPEAGNTSIRLLTLSGFTVKTISLGMQKKGQVSIPIDGLLEGIYLVELRCGTRLSTQKIIKQ